MRRPGVKAELTKALQQARLHISVYLRLLLASEGAVRQDRDEDIWLEIPCGLMIKIL